jgi:DNA-binding HxlR family transcriptional regulator
MSLRSHPPAESTHQTSENPSVTPETVLELLDDDHSRTILISLQHEPKCARALKEECQTSRPTIYRRLNRLESAGLIEARMSLHPEGHHRKEFVAVFDQITLNLTKGEIVAEINM